MTQYDVDKWDDCQYDMKNTRLLDIIAKLTAGETNCNVTRRRLSLGARDSTTGHRAKNFTEDTVKAVFIPKGNTQLALKVGTYVRSEGLLCTLVGFKERDEVKLVNSQYWEIKAVREFWRTQDDFVYRECDLTYMPFHV